MPDGAIAWLDFTTQTYVVDGLILNIVSILGGVDTDDIDSNGMAVWHTNTNRPVAIGALAALIEGRLASGMTIVFEIDYDGDGSALIGISDHADFNSADFAIETYMDAGGGASHLTVSDYEDVDFQDDFASFVDPGINLVGMTFSRDIGGGDYRWAGTVNGDTALTDDVTYSVETKFTSVAKITIGHIDDYSVAFDASYIRSITIYPAVDEAALASLTEPFAEVEIVGTPVTTGVNGAAYAGFTVSASLGEPPYVFSVFAGSLPSGLALDPDTGVVSGTPDTAEVQSGIVIRVTDDIGGTDDLAPFAITITETTISGTPDSPAPEDEPYSFVPGISGGTAPYAWTLEAGTLPSGLSLDPDTGEISGTPDTIETQSGIVIRATDDNGIYDELGPFEIDVTAGTTIAAHPDLLFLEGFDEYPSAHGTGGVGQRWTWNTNNNAILFAGRHGGQALGTDSTSASRFLTKDFSSQNRVCVGFAQRCSATPESDTAILSLYSGGVFQTAISVNTSRGMNVFNPSSSVIGSTANGLITTASPTWHYIEFEADVSAGEARIWIDGTLELSLTGVNVGTNPYDRVDFALRPALDSGNADSTRHAIDDIYCAKQAISPTVPKRIVCLLPASDASPNQWTPDSGADHYATVDKTLNPATANDDTGNSHLETSTDGHEEFFGLSAMPYTPATIFGAQVDQSFRKTSTTGAASLRPRARAVFGDLDGVTVAHPDGAGTNNYFFLPARGQDASTALLIDIDGDIADVEIGVEAIDASPSLRLQALWLQVLGSIAT